MGQLVLTLAGMCADHHVIAARGLLREDDSVAVMGASALAATLRREYDPAGTDPQRLAGVVRPGLAR